jgi:hypothetical protein
MSSTPKRDSASTLVPSPISFSPPFRFPYPSPNAGGISAAGQPVAQPAIDTAIQAHDKAHDPSAVVPATTVHQYNIVSHRTDNVLVELISRAPSSWDLPVLYIGEELRGHILWSSGALGGIEMVDVVVSGHAGRSSID